jgi:hypothetical protein
VTDVQMAPEAQEAPAPDVAAPDIPNDAPAREAASPPDLEALAREMGWRPKEDWKGDDSGWRDAGEFVKHTVDANRTLKRELGEVKDTIKGLSKTNEKILQRELDKQRVALERKFAQAVDANDPTEARRVSAEIDALERQPVQQDYKAKFRAENPWFGDDKEATAYATAMAGVAASEGKDPDAQLAYAAEKTRKRFPELFDAKPVQRNAPSVEGGQRGAPPPKKTYPPAVLNAARQAVERKRADSVQEYLAMYDAEMR